MTSLLKIHSRLTNILSLTSLFLSFILGILLSWIVKNNLTENTFRGKDLQ